jgi:hypothetical protein
LAEELPPSGGHARILAAIGRGRRRFSEIASDAGQRVEAPLETLVRAGFVRKALPVGAPKAARPLYEIADAYLAFWFSCLYATQSEIEGGQGRAVLSRMSPRWQQHVGWVFEEAARAHAAQLVRDQELPKTWWLDVGGPPGARSAKSTCSVCAVSVPRWSAKRAGRPSLSASRISHDSKGSSPIFRSLSTIRALPCGDAPASPAKRAGREHSDLRWKICFESGERRPCYVRAVSEPAKRRATYDDLLAVPGRLAARAHARAPGYRRNVSVRRYTPLKIARKLTEASSDQAATRQFDGPDGC